MGATLSTLASERNALVAEEVQMTCLRRSSLVRRLCGALSGPRGFGLLTLALALPAASWDGAQPAPQADLDLGGRFLRETARDYREQSRYPNDSWPLKPGQVDPVKDERTANPVSVRSEGIELRVWPAVVGFEAPEPVDLFAALSTGLAPLEARQITGEVVGPSGEVIGQFDYLDDGQGADEKAGDGTYSARLNWIPAPELAEIYLVRVQARTPEGKPLHASGGFLYGRPWAHLTGQYRDSLRDGNVVVAAEVEVTRSGRFHLSGTLYSGEKQPLGVAQNAAHLEPGRHWLELAFFGLMFHDRGSAGPYRLGSAVLTTVSALPGAPSRLAQDVHVTKPYALSSLRSTPFDRADLVDAAERLEAAAEPADVAVRYGSIAEGAFDSPSAGTTAAEPCLIFVHGMNYDGTYDNWSEAREYWQSWFWGTDFIATATNYFARSYYVVGYDGSRPWSEERAAGKVASEIIHASQGGTDGGGNRCARTYAQGGTFWVVAHSMGGPVMDFILGNDDESDPYYNHTGRFDLVSQKLSGVITLSGAHRGSEFADAVCTLGQACSVLAHTFRYCDDVTQWLRTDDNHQVRRVASPPARAVYLTGGYESNPASAYCLTGEDDQALQYASIYACSGSGTAYYDNSNVCSNGQKQESSGFRNLDAGREDHTTIHNDSDRDARRAIPDGLWTCGGVPCQPNTVVNTTMSAAQLVDYIFANACHYSLSPAAQTFPALGGAAFVMVGATSSCPGTWSYSSNNPSWLNISSVSGGAVYYTVAANPGGSPRTGTLTIAGETFTVTQDGGSASCSYSISPAAKTVDAGGGPGTVSVTAGSGCMWTAASNDGNWLTLTSGGSGSGNGTVGYSVATNGTSSVRVGTLTVAGKTFTLTQNGATQGNDYPYAASSCSAADSWNFVTRQCTSFAAWRMNRDTGVTALGLSENSYPFSNHMGGRLSQANRLSDAAGWATKLQALGYAVDGNPRVGDIAQWNANEGGASSVGHVAYVSAVNADGSVDVEEYNWSTSCGYGTRHLTGSSRPPRYIHFEGSKLIVRPNSEDVYFLQNGRAYHVTEYPLAQAMETADAPGWVWSGRRHVDQAEWVQYTTGPAFLAADYNSDGLLLQEMGTSPVYRMEGGQRRWVRSPEVVINCLGGFPNVIAVPSSVLSSYVPSIGDDMPLADSSASFSGSGGSGSIDVDPGGPCSWTAASNDGGWLTVTSGVNGIGTDQVTFTVAPNQSTSPRTGTLTIAGQQFTVDQAGQSCSYTLQPTFKSFPASGGTDYVGVTTSGSCTWTAASSQPSWLAVPIGNSQTGSGSLYYSVAPNTDSASRTAKLTIGGKVFNVSQAGLSCTYSIGPDQSVGGAAGNGLLAVTAASGCGWSASSNAPTWLRVTSGNSGTSNGTVGFSFTTNPGASPRVGTLAVEGLTFTLTQAGSGVSNDEIAGATPVSGLPATLVEDTTAATGNASDPVHSCGTSSRDSKTVWFRYVATFSGTLRVTTVNSSYDTVLTAYPGTTSAGAELACGDDLSGGLLQSEIGFAVTSGQSYLIEVSGWGTSSTGGQLELSVAPAGYAFHDPLLGVPRCRAVGNTCDSGAWLTGRASLGPEPHQPNTLDACEDGLQGGFHVDESNDRIRVVTLDGSNFAAGKSVRVEATVWAYSSYADDRLDLYYAADASSPNWTLIQTLAPSVGGAQTLSATYSLPPGPLQAVRARFRYLAGPAACGVGSYEDHDDLVFAVSTLPSVTTGSAAAISTSAATLTASVSPNGVQTTTQFEYGTTTSYGSVVSAQTVTGTTVQSISAQISGLTCGTPYHFKAKASNAGGTVSGGDVVFTTSACPGLSGTVRDSGTGLPLADVQVYVYDAAGQFVGYGQSNASGAYVLSTGLPTGTYYARTTNWAGYLDELYNDIGCAGGSCSVTSGTPISVTAGTTRTGIDFGLARGGRISGAVTNVSTGTPLANVRVDIAAANGSWVAYGVTDSSGSYTTAAGLNPGTYFARTSNQAGYLDELYNNLPCPNGACTVTSGTPISVSAGTTTPGISFGLVQGGRISGVVTDSATGAPIENVRVVINVASGAYVTAAFTDSSGAYTVPSLVAGTYYVTSSNELGYVDEMFANVPCPGGSCTTSSGTPVTVTAGSTTGGVNLGLDRGARVNGSVSDATTGQALAGVTVYVYNPSGWYMGYGVTGANGAYTTRSGLPTGTYYARTEGAAGHIDELWDNIPCPGGACWPPSGTPLSLTAGVTRPGVNFSLWSAGAISGTVTSSTTGLPIVGAEVDVYDSTGSWKTYGSTNGSGVYTTVDPLRPGTYYLATWNAQGYLDELYNNVPCPGGTCSVTGGTPVVVGGGTVSGISFALAPGGRIGGTLTDSSTGQPLPYQEVRLFDSAGTQVRSGYTNSSGAYLTSSGLVPGTYYARTANTLGYADELYNDLPCPNGACTVTAGTAISVTAGATASGIDFGLQAGGRISGTITDASSGLPLANIGVYVFPPSGGYVASAYTDSTGTYTVLGLATGTYYARSWDWGDYVDELYDNVPCPGWSCGLSGGAPISVTGSQATTGIDFSLVRGGRVGGTVTDATTGQPLAGVDVLLYGATGAYVTRGTTGSLGTYATPGVPAGTYYARTSNSAGYADELFDGISCPAGGCAATNGTAIAVGTGTTASGTDFTLSPGGGFQGTVAQAGTGQPLSGVSVWIFDSTGWLLASRTTDATGAYGIAGLSPGSYFAMTVNSQGYVDELYNDIPCPGGSCDVTAGTPVTVQAGVTTTGIDFALVRGGFLSGTVTDAATGQPLSSVSVRIYNSSGTLFATRASGASGTFSTTAALPAGAYYARTSNSQGYVDELYNDIPCPGGTCVVTSGTPISVTAPATTTGVDFALTRGGSIGGTVTDAATGALLAGVNVRIYNTSGVQVTSRTTSASGTYLTTAGLPAGTYFARTSNSQGYVDELFDNLSCAGGACSVTTGTPIAVQAGTTAGNVDFALAAGGRVSGTLIDESSGAFLASATVRIYDQGGTLLTTGTTDSAGHYVTGSGLVPGDYHARGGARGYLDEVFDGQPCPNGVCTPTSGTAIPVTLGATTTGIDFALAPAPAQTNDEIPGAIGIATWPFHASEDTRSATTNATDPTHSCATATRDSNSVWFRFVATFNGTARVSTANSNYDTVLTAYPGTTSVGPELACNDDSNGGQQSEVRFPVQAGQSYLVEVTTYGSPSGGTLHLTLDPAFVKGDMNGDGLPDLVFRSLSSRAHNKVWFMDGVARTAEADVDPDAASADWKIRGVDDFDGDGSNDLVFWNELTGHVEFWLMNGTTRSGTPIPLSGAPVLATNWDLSGTADFNGDHQPDIVWRNFTTQKIVIWTMNGTTKTGAIIPSPEQAVDANWMVVAALDYNGDGSTDFLWYNYTSGKIVTWYMNASVIRVSGQFTTPANAGDNNWKVVASSDYSHDHVPGTPPLGSPDVVWRNENSGNQVVWHLDTASRRVHGEFTNPTANTPPLDWSIVGPR